MAAPAGFAGQIGFKSESTVGTAVTVDTFHGGLLSESLKQEITRLESQGIRAGRRTTARWKAGAKTVGGSISFELHNQPMRDLLKHMFGSVSTVTGASVNTHTATPGDLTGDALTIQVGRPDVGGTVQPFTYAGCKFPQWEITCGVDEIAQLNLEVSAQSESTATSLATASYSADASPFVFTEGSLSIAGSSVAVVRSMSLTGTNALATDRFRIGSATVKEQLENGLREYTGTVESDFESLTAYNRFVNGTEAALEMAFDNGTDSLTITCNVRFDGETPELSGPELLVQNLPFKCVHSSSDASAITAVLVNAEASA